MLGAIRGLLQISRSFRVPTNSLPCILLQHVNDNLRIIAGVVAEVVSSPIDCINGYCPFDQSYVVAYAAAHPKHHEVPKPMGVVCGR